MTLTVWGVLVRYFEGCFSIRIVWYFFLILELWSLRRKTTEVKYHFHHILSRIHDLSLLILILSTCLRQCFSVFCTEICLPSLHHSIQSSLEGNHYVQSTYKEWRVMLHLLEGTISTHIIWNSSIQEICLFSQFIYLFIHSYLYQYGLMNIHYNRILLYFVP